MCMAKYKYTRVKVGGQLSDSAEDKVKRCWLSVLELQIDLKAHIQTCFRDMSNKTD